MGTALPTGTVTFLFTDVEGSTALLQRLGAEAYAQALGEHREIVRDSLATHDGVEVDTQGDSFFCAFGSARAAVECAREVLERLETTPIRVRVGLHTGEALVDGDRYVGLDVHRAARVGASGHGGQAVLSPSTVALLEPGAVVLGDLGEHRLKDLSAPIRLHQLGTAEFPPLNTLFRTNLPVPATEFVGRAEEIRDLVDRASERSVRLLTLTGPGGTGKTRLALQLAGELGERFPDGVRWAPLASLRDPALVASTVAQALDVDEEPGAPPEETIADAVGGATVLLLLDNCEHVLDACVSVVSRLVASCPNALVLVTSREPLDVFGEHVVQVAPLAPEEAAALFATRARAAGADIPSTPESRAVIAELCAQLDELPLAVELAAARAATIPPAALLARLSDRLDVLRGPRDADERQRTLRATIEWSYDLLEPAERRLFRRLAVFRGGATLEAVEEVCEATVDDLASLVAKSLVRQQVEPDGLPRYWTLETIRAFAAEELSRAGEDDDLRARHLEWFAALARDPRLRAGGSAGHDRLAQLERDRDNLRAALDCALADGRSREVVTVAGVLARLHDVHGRWAEAEDVLRAALQLAEDSLDVARLETLLAHVLVRRRRPDEAWRTSRSAEDRLGGPPGDGSEAWWEAWLDVKLEQAHQRYWQADHEALATDVTALRPLVAEHGSARQRIDFLHVMLQEAYRRERYVLSEETETLARELHRASRDGEEDEEAEFFLGFCLLWRGRPAEAEPHLRLGAEEASRRGTALVEVRCLVYGALACRLQSDLEGARERLAVLERLDDELLYSGLAAAMRCWLAAREGDLDAAEAFGAEAVADWSSERRTGPTVFQWTARFPLLGVALARGRVQEAFEHARRMLDESQRPLPDEIRAPLERAVEQESPAALAEALEAARERGYA